jgi:uncharacterized repeat protein (TIGR03806 family)
VLALALTACSPVSSPDVDDGETGAPPEDLPDDDDEPLPPLSERPDVRSCRLDGTAAGALPRLTTSPIDGLTFSDAVQILPAPTSGLWVVEAGGRIWSIDPATDTPAELVVDLSDRVDCCASRGLLAAAIGPGPELFVHYHRADQPNRARVARLSFDPVASVADPTSEQSVIEIDHDGTAASGGALAFDADGMLLIGVGDDTVAPPPNPDASPARDRMDLRGSILRLDVSGGGPGYAIPPDNPFVADPQARPELFAIGLHDPQACTTDLESGRTWCSDAGSGVRDELDLLLAGADYGWPIVEGSVCTLGECEASLYAGPLADYGLEDVDAEQQHCRMRAGPIYRGATLPDLQGVQLFGDRCSGRTFGLRSELGATEILAAVPSGIAAIGADASGEPWIVDGEGRLARVLLAEDGQPGTLPTALSQTGCFAALTNPAPDAIPYLVASALWSDGLLKYRYMVVPPGERVRVGSDGRWWFPAGSLLIKTFVHERTPGDPETRQPVETRFMVRRNGAWEFHTYRWTDDGSDALLLDADETRTLQVDAREGAHEFEWTFPDEIGCRNCHGFATARALGPNTAQLNREVRYGDGPPVSQLAALEKLELLELEPGLRLDPASLPALTDPREVDAPLQERARAYMQANCAHCHRPDWMRPDLRMDTPMSETGLCEMIEFPSPWVDGYARVVPGAPEQSNLWLRMGTRGKGQMPPLGTALVDPLGHALIGAWIDELENCL